MTSHRKLPSPAMAVAFTALFLVLGGSAVGAERQEHRGQRRHQERADQHGRHPQQRRPRYGCAPEHAHRDGHQRVHPGPGRQRKDWPDSAKKADSATTAGRATSAGTGHLGEHRVGAHGCRIQNFYLEGERRGAASQSDHGRRHPDHAGLCRRGARTSTPRTGHLWRAQFFANGGYSPTTQQFSAQDEDFISADNFGLSPAGSETGNGTAVAIFETRQTTTLHYGWNRIGTSTRTPAPSLATR